MITKNNFVFSLALSTALFAVFAFLGGLACMETTEEAGEQLTADEQDTEVAEGTSRLATSLEAHQTASIVAESAANAPTPYAPPTPDSALSGYQACSVSYDPFNLLSGRTVYYNYLSNSFILESPSPFSSYGSSTVNVVCNGWTFANPTFTRIATAAELNNAYYASCSSGVPSMYCAQTGTTARKKITRYTCSLTTSGTIMLFMKKWTHPGYFFSNAIPASASASNDSSHPQPCCDVAFSLAMNIIYTQMESYRSLPDFSSVYWKLGDSGIPACVATARAYETYE